MAIATERDRRNLLGIRGIGSPIGLPREATTAIGGRHHFVMVYYRGEIIASIGPHGKLAVLGYRNRLGVPNMRPRRGDTGLRARLAIPFERGRLS